jgi:glutamate N-acetyltransferase/amino-acid N-acetyltransferase
MSMLDNALPAGFQVESDLMVNHGPIDTAVGQFGGVDLAAPALWSRQVLTDSRLRAVAIVPSVDGTGPEQFRSVHATAERTATRLGIGAVEVAVWWVDTAVSRQALRLTADGWSVAGYVSDGDLVVLLTDAVITAITLDTAVATAWPPRTDESVLVLASGRSESTPTGAEFAATLSALHRDLACSQGGAA